MFQLLAARHTLETSRKLLTTRLLHQAAMSQQQNAQTGPVRRGRGGGGPRRGQRGRGRGGADSANGQARGALSNGASISGAPYGQALADRIAGPSSATAAAANGHPTTNGHSSASKPSETLKAHISHTQFSSFVQQGLLSPEISVPFVTCTDVQAMTLPVILQGHDVLAQAKTGTGKTVAFLVPALQRLLSSRTPRGNGQVGVLVISPTRELATQIAESGKMLLRNLPGIGVQTATGGNNLNTELRNIRQGRADILVATPGRLQDYLENHNFKQNVSTLEVLVLDEADRLLDQGFKPAIVAISKMLPNKVERPRQSLLFSATISKEVKQIASAVLSSKHTFISTLNEDELNVHQHVPQFVVQTSLAAMFASTLAVLQQEIAANPSTSKVMLFFPTARSTGLFYELLTQLPRDALAGIETHQIHSRMSQSARSKAADRFKDALSGILVSSDVTARGMDFPNVTLVLQVGIPQNAEQYIHRLGRTARAGQGGKGILVLTKDEMAFLNQKEIKDLPVQPMPLDEAILASAGSQCASALDKVSPDAKSSAYAAWLGYYKGFGKMLKWTVPHLIDQAKLFALETCRYTGQMPGQTPPLLAKTIGMMGLRDYRSSFNVVSELPGKPARNQGGSRKPRA